MQISSAPLLTAAKLAELVALGYNRISQIYLHWTAGRYGQLYDDYHFNIDADGSIYQTCTQLTELKSHTWHRNTGAIGIALCCACGALPHNGRDTEFGKYVINDAVADEDALIGALGLFDTMYGQDYKIGMRYYQFNVHYRDITHNFDVARMTVHNLKRAYDCIVAHKNSFENHQIYNEVINMLINTFTQGKDTMTFLREMKSQGSDITLQLDINKIGRASCRERV